MRDDYGQKVGSAVQAVLRLHLDISRLFGELDNNEYRGWKSISDKYVVKNLSGLFDHPPWMPDYVFRYYHQAINLALVEGITCLFFLNDVAFEPEFVVSQVHYRTRDGQISKFKRSDVRDLFFEMKESLLPEMVLEFQTERHDRI